MANEDRSDLRDDAVSLRLELDTLDVANASLPPDAPRDELLSTAAELIVKTLRFGNDDLIAAARMRRADVLIAARRYAEAIEDLDAARAALGELREQDLQVLILNKGATAYAALQDWQGVSQVCAEGIELVEKYRYKVTALYQQSAYLRYRIGLYTLGVRAAYELGQQALMLERAELAKCRSVLRYQQPATSASSSASSSASAAAVTTDEQEVETQFREVCEKIDAAQSRDGKVSPPLLQKRRMLWDILTIRRSQARGRANFSAFKLETVQAALAADEAVVYYFWLDRETLLISTLDRTRLVSELRAVSGAEREALEAYAHYVLAFKQESAKGELDKVRNFSALLMPDKGSPLLREKERLIFSPHRLLHAFPFHALLWEEDFLVKQFAVSYVPNLTSLMLRYEPCRQPSVLALGVADYHIAGCPLGKLAEAETEIDDLEQTYRAETVPVTALRGRDATEDRLRELRAEGKLEQFSCLHFASHGMNIESDTPMESHLFLSDSKLEGLEIAEWKLNAELVVLSACCSGQRPISGRGMQELPGDDLFGLQAAFFAAGARRVLCSLWPVDSLVAHQIMTGVHRHIAQGKQPEVALQMAVKNHLQTAGAIKRRSYYWAPFFLSTVGRAHIGNGG